MKQSASNEEVLLKPDENGPEQDQPEYGFLHLRVLLPFLFLSLIWGSTWLVIRDQISSVPAGWSVTYRFLVAAVAMFALAKIMRLKLTIDRSTHQWAMLVGLLQFMANFNLVYMAEHYVTSGLVAVLFALLIVPNAILGWFFLGRQVSRSFWIGSAIAIVGIGLLILREYRVASVGGSAVLVGAALTIAAVIGVSFSNVLQASHRLNKFPIVTMLAWGMFYGSLLNITWALFVHGMPAIDTRPGYLGGVLYLSIVGSVMTFPLYFQLVRDIGPGKAAYTSVLVPVVAMLLSTLFEGYVWSGLAASGAALAMVGLLISMQAAKPSR
jgi:drug/metabolite transporter (DMT)-like permease